MRVAPARSISDCNPLRRGTQTVLSHKRRKSGIAGRHGILTVQCFRFTVSTAGVAVSQRVRR